MLVLLHSFHTQLDIDPNRTLSAHELTCHRYTFCTDATPQKIIPIPIMMDVTSAGTSSKLTNVNRITPAIGNKVSIQSESIIC